MIAKEFQIVGRKLFESSLNNSHSGNMSVRLGNRMYITTTGSQLGSLAFSDVVDISVFGDEKKNASTECVVHRSIYRATSAKAVVHAHPPFVTALSMLIDRFEPEDAEGKYYFKSIPVVKVNNAIGSQEVAEKIPAYFSESPIVIVGGHGTFAIADSLELGYKWTSSVESSAKILYYKLIYQKYYKL